jgi:hypothetical protein
MVKLPYYNQNNYGGYPYPSASKPKATVKSGGCGVVCISMIVEGLTNKRFPPPVSAQYSINIGARASGGTDMRKLAKSIANEYGLDYTISNNSNDLRDCLINGGVAIANVSGNTGKTGLFSDSGHFVVVNSYNSKNKKVHVMDPGYYNGKYELAGRKGKVEADSQGGSCLLSVLHADCAGRSPRYYLFKKRKASDDKMTQAQFDKYIKTYQEKNNPIYENLKDVPSYWKKDVETMIKSGIIKGEHGKEVNMSRDTLKSVIIAYRLAK